VTNIGYLVGEESWGQTSSMIMNMEATKGTPIKWASAWKQVGHVSQLTQVLDTFLCAGDLQRRNACRNACAF